MVRHISKIVQRWAKRLPPLPRVYWIATAAVAITLTTALTVQVVHAACGPDSSSDFCSSTYGLSGGVSTLNLTPPNSAPSKPNVDQAQLLSSGPLLYPDYKTLEAQARDLLARSVKFRQDISPYRGQNNFNDLVRHFDEQS